MAFRSLVRGGALAALPVLAALAVPALPAHAVGPSYVALGDSYSSGTGTRSYLSDGTTCQRSTYAYPSLIAAARGYALNFRACSGAKIPDVTASQLGALSATTAYASISVGGNDAGFAAVLTECAQPGWMSSCNAAIDRAQSYVTGTLPGALGDALRLDPREGAEREGRRRGLSADLQRRGLQRGHLLLPGGGDPAERDGRPAQQQDVGGRGGQGILLRQPDLPLRRPRGLRRRGVAQRLLQPGHRELPPEPARARLRLHADGEPGPDRQHRDRHRDDAAAGTRRCGPARRAAAGVRRPGRGGSSPRPCGRPT